PSVGSWEWALSSAARPLLLKRTASGARTCPKMAKKASFQHLCEEKPMKPVGTTVVVKDGRGTDSNPDPITGEPGAHPVGTGVGAALAGAAAGAAGGLVGG